MNVYYDLDEQLSQLPPKTKTYYCTDMGCDNYHKVFYLTESGSLLPNRFAGWSE